VIKDQIDNANLLLLCYLPNVSLYGVKYVDGPIESY